VFLTCAVLAACGGIVHRKPGPSSTRWIEVRSPHFTVRSDLDADDVRGKIDQLEASWDALATIYGAIFPEKPRPDVRLVVSYFDDCEELYGDANIAYGGWVTTTPDYGWERVVTACEPSRLIHGSQEGERELITHELAHAFNNAYVPAMPVWLQEGLAEYMATATADGDTVRFGQRNQLHKPEFGKPSPKDLLAMETWQPKGRNYGNAWAFVHLLFDSDAYRDGLLAYLNALAAATPWDQAWAATLGPAAARLEADYSDHVHGGQYRIRAMPRAVRTEVKVTQRALSLDEAIDEWLRMKIATIDETDDAAFVRRVEGLILQLEGAYAEWKGSAFWRAIAASMRKIDASAFAQLRAVAEANPSDGRALAGVVLLSVGALGEDADLGQRAADAAPIEADARALLRIANRPGELLAVARYYAAAGKPSTGLNFAWRALERDAGCDACEHTLAALLAQQGRLDEAIAHQRRAIGMINEGAPPKRYTDRLAYYERKRP
jgi:tetratricopeptide (TPR) repeat protein